MSASTANPPVQSAADSHPLLHSEAGGEVVAQRPGEGAGGAGGVGEDGLAAPGGDVAEDEP